ncbi:MAG: hypothetical protein WDZ59_12680 [Pirellulales bacterium]
MTVARVIVGVFGVIFLGIGLTVLVSLWIAPFGAFGSPPLFFRIVGTFIAIGFVTMGGAAVLAAITGKGLGSHADLRRMNQAGGEHAPRTPGDRLACPRCGAPLAKSADVSPHGDALCTYCRTWFNIHGK